MSLGISWNWNGLNFNPDVNAARNEMAQGLNGLTKGIGYRWKEQRANERQDALREQDRQNAIADRQASWNRDDAIRAENRQNLLDDRDYERELKDLDTMEQRHYESQINARNQMQKELDEARAWEREDARLADQQELEDAKALNAAREAMFTAINVAKYAKGNTNMDIDNNLQSLYQARQAIAALKPSEQRSAYLTTIDSEIADFLGKKKGKKAKDDYEKEREQAEINRARGKK